MFLALRRIHVSASDFSRSRRFYGETLGASRGGRIRERLGRIRAGPSASQAHAPSPRRSAVAQPGRRRILDRVLDETIAKLKERGVTVTRPPTDEFTGRSAEILDPDGYRIIVFQASDLHPDEDWVPSIGRRRAREAEAPCAAGSASRRAATAKKPAKKARERRGRPRRRTLRRGPRRRSAAREEARDEKGRRRRSPRRRSRHAAAEAVAPPRGMAPRDDTPKRPTGGAMMTISPPPRAPASHPLLDFRRSVVVALLLSVFAAPARRADGAASRRVLPADGGTVVSKVNGPILDLIEGAIQIDVTNAKITGGDDRLANPLPWSGILAGSRVVAQVTVPDVLPAVFPPRARRDDRRRVPRARESSRASIQAVDIAQESSRCSTGRVKTTRATEWSGSAADGRRQGDRGSRGGDVRDRRRREFRASGFSRRASKPGRRRCADLRVPRGRGDHAGGVDDRGPGRAGGFRHEDRRRPEGRRHRRRRRENP